MTRRISERVQEHGIARSGATERCARENDRGQNTEKKFGIHMAQFMSEETGGCQAFVRDGAMGPSTAVLLAEKRQLLLARSLDFCRWRGEQIPQTRVPFGPAGHGLDEHRLTPPELDLRTRPG